MKPAADNAAAIAKKTPEQAAKPKWDIHWGWAISGATIRAVSLSCIAIEAVRNFVFGARGVHDPLDAAVSGCSWAVFAAAWPLGELHTLKAGCPGRN